MRSEIAFGFVRNLQCDRNTIHKNLVFCLCIAESIFLVGIIQYDKPVRVASIWFWFCHFNLTIKHTIIDRFNAI